MKASVIVLVLICAANLCEAQAPAAATVPEADRAVQWQQDLKFFADEFPGRHIDFEKLYSRTAFAAEVAALQENAAGLTDADIVLRLMQLVASAHVGHTNVYLPVFNLGFRQIPLSLHWYADGLTVVGAAPEHADTLGTRVLRIGSKTPDELLTFVSPYISYENETWLKEQSPGYLETLKLLQDAGAAGAGGQVVFTLAKPGGKPFQVTVTPGDPRVKQLTIFDALSIPTPLYRKRPASYYWYEYLPDSRALYIQYNRCQQDSQLAFKDFARDLFAFADSHPVDRVIVDVRFNSGGNSLVIAPLIGGLRERAALAAHLYVLIGTGTFSSAQDNAIWLRREFHATLVGEATGEKPNSYGEVKRLTLPNSKLIVQYSTKFFRMLKDDDPPSLEPDIRAPRTLEDVLAGRDGALDAALHHPRQPPRN